MTRAKAKKWECRCSLLGKEAIPHMIKTTSPHTLSKHAQQYMWDCEKRALENDTKVRGKAEEKSRERIVRENTVPLHMRSHPEDTYKDATVPKEKVSNFQTASVEEVPDEDDGYLVNDMDSTPLLDEIRAATKRRPENDNVNHSESEDSCEGDFETGDDSDDEDGGKARRGGLERTMAVEYEAFLEMVQKFIEEAEQADTRAKGAQEEEEFDYKNPIYETTITDLETLILNDIRKAGGGIARRQFRRLQTFIDMSTTNGRPKDERAAAKLLASATYFSGKNYDCCINSCMGYYSYPKLRFCRICKEPHFRSDGKPRAQYTVFPLEHRLKLFYSRKDRARLFQEYREGAERTLKNHKLITDYWSGKLHETLVEERGLFADPGDIGLVLSTDGTKAFRVCSSYPSGLYIIVSAKLISGTDTF